MLLRTPGNVANKKKVFQWMTTCFLKYDVMYDLMYDMMFDLMFDVMHDLIYDLMYDTSNMI